MAELTDDDLADIRTRFALGHAALLDRIARRYGVGADCIEAIVRGRPWRHLVDQQDAATGDLFGDGG